MCIYIYILRLHDFDVRMLGLGLTLNPNHPSSQPQLTPNLFGVFIGGCRG